MGSSLSWPLFLPPASLFFFFFCFSVALSAFLQFILFSCFCLQGKTCSLRLVLYFAVPRFTIRLYHSPTLQLNLSFPESDICLKFTNCSLLFLASDKPEIYTWILLQLECSVSRYAQTLFSLVLKQHWVMNLSFMTKSQSVCQSFLMIFFMNYLMTQKWTKELRNQDLI